MHALKITLVFILPLIFLILGLHYVFFGNRGKMANVTNSIVLKEYVDILDKEVEVRFLPDPVESNSRKNSLSEEEKDNIKRIVDKLKVIEHHR